MPAPPNIVLWIVCIWLVFRASYRLVDTVVKIRDAMEAEERRINRKSREHRES